MQPMRSHVLMEWRVLAPFLFFFFFGSSTQWISCTLGVDESAHYFLSFSITRLQENHTNESQTQVCNHDGTILPWHLLKSPFWKYRIVCYVLRPRSLARSLARRWLAALRLCARRSSSDDDDDDGFHAMRTRVFAIARGRCRSFFFFFVVFPSTLCFVVAE
jgi:hypothetical protein